MNIQSGVLQESVLGPLLFNLYMLLLGITIENNNISYYSYANDTDVPTLFL